MRTRRRIKPFRKTKRKLSRGKEKKTIYKARDGIVIPDALTKKFLQGNTAIYSMLRYTKEEIESLTIYDIQLMTL
jgi:hypothetical protein